MKYTFVFIPALAMMLGWQSSIYTIHVEPVGGGNAISLSAYANKKIMVTAIQSSNPPVAHLLWLDSLQNANASLQIIVVPSKDINGISNDNALTALKTGLSLDFVISKSAYVKKSAGDNQHPLFKWLTQVNENGHFDKDAVTTGQLFIVSESGRLYSVLDDDTPAAVLSQALSQVVN